MSRIEEALRRAGKTVGSRESLNVPSGRALDWFPADATSSAPEDDPAASVSLFETDEDRAQPVAAAVADAPAAVADAPAAVADAPAAVVDVPAAVVDVPAAPVHIGTAESREKLVVNGMVPSAAAEQYRRVAGLLHHLQKDRGIHVVMVASATPAEGKTLTAANLALTFSQSYKRRVLLIDADLRRPMLHEVLGVENSRRGLSALLRAADDYQLKTTHVSDLLELAPSGAPDPDPMSGLTSDRMRRVINDAASRFDWVILDTPPVALLPDANLLAAMVDVAVLVVAAGRTPVALVEKAIEIVGRDRIMGVVLNRVAPENMPGAAYNYGYYHYYGRAAQGTRG